MNEIVNSVNIKIILMQVMQEFTSNLKKNINLYKEIEKYSLNGGLNLS